MNDQKRSSPRYQHQLAVDVELGASRFSAQTRDLSLGGAFIETDELVPFGAQITLRFRVRTEPTDEICIGAQVRWVEREGDRVSGVGVSFDGLRARDAYALNKFFAESARVGVPS